MFVQVKDLMKFCRLSFSDALLWLITFFTVVILDIEYGLLIGGILCFAKLIILSVIPHGCKLALVPDTELYLDIERYRKVKEKKNLLFNSILKFLLLVTLKIYS